MHIHRFSRRALACYLSGAALGLFGACAKQEPPPPTVLNEPANELRWARAALERNPAFKVMGVDAERNAIKVTVKASGETLSVTPGELAAIPISDLLALTRTPAPEAAKTETPPPAPVEEVAAVEEPARAERTNTDYKVDYPDGRMRITAPGMSVEATDPALRSQAQASAPHFDEPIICEGPRLMHLDRRRLNVQGDAIIARGGCELHLTNSQVAATGTAIVVRDATVHINNSTVQGEAAFDAGAASKLFLANTRLVGIARREEGARITEQGGNTWR